MKMYFIAQVLPGNIDTKVRVFKQQVLEQFGCKVGLKSPAHITIVPPFWMDEEKEQRLMRDIASIASRVCPFNMSTNNFSCFKPRTLFIAVEKSDSLNTLKQISDRHFEGEDFKIKKENRPFHPHITIATRDLHKKAFTEVWPLFENKPFKETWVAEGLSLLKHNGATWDVIYTAPFSCIT